MQFPITIKKTMKSLFFFHANYHDLVIFAIDKHSPPGVILSIFFSWTNKF